MGKFSPVDWTASANALRRIWTAKLTLRGQNRRRSVVRSLANGTQAPVAERGVRSRLGKESAPWHGFFRCVFVDEFGHTVFPANITADNLETAKRQAFVVLETPHRMPDSRFSR
jgi:hypothetical protein